MRKAAGLARKGVRRKQQQEKQQQQQQEKQQQQQQQHQQYQGKNQYQREDSGKIQSNDGSPTTGQRRQPTEEEAALTAKNYRMAKELSELRVRHREETKNVTRLTMENMNLASRCREAINHVSILKKELSVQQRRAAEALALQRQQQQRMNVTLPDQRMQPSEAAKEMDRMDRILAVHAPPPPPPPPPKVSEQQEQEEPQKNSNGNGYTNTNGNSNSPLRPASQSDDNAPDEFFADFDEANNKRTTTTTVTAGQPAVSSLSRSSSSSLPSTSSMSALDRKLSADADARANRNGNGDADDDNETMHSGLASLPQKQQPMFPHSASPQLGSFSKKRSKGVDYNEGFPEDLMSRRPAPAFRTSPGITEADSESVTSNNTVSPPKRTATDIMSSMDAFEASFNMAFPPTFSGSNDSGGTPDNATNTGGGSTRNVGAQGPPGVPVATTAPPPTVPPPMVPATTVTAPAATATATATPGIYNPFFASSPARSASSRETPSTPIQSTPLVPPKVLHLDIDMNDADEEEPSTSMRERIAIARTLTPPEPKRRAIDDGVDGDSNPKPSLLIPDPRTVSDPPARSPTQSSDNLPTPTNATLSRAKSVPQRLFPATSPTDDKTPPNRKADNPHTPPRKTHKTPDDVEQPRRPEKTITASARARYENALQPRTFGGHQRSKSTGSAVGAKLSTSGSTNAGAQASTTTAGSVSATATPTSKTKPPSETHVSSTPPASTDRSLSTTNSSAKKSTPKSGSSSAHAPSMVLKRLQQRRVKERMAGETNSSGITSSPSVDSGKRSPVPMKSTSVGSNSKSNGTDPVLASKLSSSSFSSSSTTPMDNNSNNMINENTNNGIGNGATTTANSNGKKSSPSVASFVSSFEAASKKKDDGRIPSSRSFSNPRSIGLPSPNGPAPPDEGVTPSTRGQARALELQQLARRTAENGLFRPSNDDARAAMAPEAYGDAPFGSPNRARNSLSNENINNTSTSSATSTGSRRLSKTRTAESMVAELRNLDSLPNSSYPQQHSITEPSPTAATTSGRFTAAGKARRSVRQPVSYAEPSLNSKLRRGDVYFSKEDEPDEVLNEIPYSVRS